MEAEELEALKKYVEEGVVPQRNDIVKSLKRKGYIREPRKGMTLQLTEKGRRKAKEVKDES